MNVADSAKRKLFLSAIHDAGNRHVSIEKLRHLGSGAELGALARYLQDHEMVTVLKNHTGDPEKPFNLIGITTKGVDYISETGGLSAELSVVTIRLHEDTLRELLIAKAQQSDGDETVKGKLVDQLKSLPAEAVLRLSEKALDAALRGWPDALQWLQATILR